MSVYKTALETALDLVMGLRPVRVDLVLRVCAACRKPSDGAVYHAFEPPDGPCARCGKRLTYTESIAIAPE
jgi:hypothetical protein